MMARLALVFLAAMVLGGPVHAQGGFDARSSQAFAHAYQAPAAARAALAAERLRALMVLQPTANPNAVTPDISLPLFAAFQGCCRTTQVSWFMRGAIVQVASLTPDMTVIGYYNPLANIWLMTTWTAVGNAEPRIIFAMLVGGEGVSARAQYWADAPHPDFAQAMVRATRSAAPGMAFQEMMQTPSAAPLLAARSETWLGSVRAWEADPERRAWSVRLLDALGRGNASAFSGQSPTSAELQALAPEVRRSMILLAAFGRPGGVSLIAGSPLRPGLLMIADFQTTPRGLRVIGLHPLNLEIALAEGNQE